MNTTDYLYTQFLDYSRRKIYYRTDKTFEYSSKSIVQLAQNSNPYCVDTMQLVVVKTSFDSNKEDKNGNGSMMSLIHRGTYCALAHASAELLCESFQYLDVYSFKDTVHYILNIEHANKKILKDNDYLQIALSVLQKKMSLTRTHCFLLAWKTMDILLENWDL